MKSILDDKASVEEALQHLAKVENHPSPVVIALGEPDKPVVVTVRDVRRALIFYMQRFNQ